VSKEAANMILADDNFATIVIAVREGRAIFANVGKILRYLLSSNLGEVLTVFLGVVGAAVIGLRSDQGALVLPLLATQILWINLVTDGGPALALGVDPEADDVMARPPRRRDASALDAGTWWGVAITGLAMALATLLTIDLFLPGGWIEGVGDLDRARTAGFTVLVLAQLFNCFNARSETTSAFRGALANRWLWLAIATSAALQVAVVHVPILNVAFATVPLTLGEWALCVAMASSVLAVDELRKAVLRGSAARSSRDGAAATAGADARRG
jgi:P-type Ca2+ transporter type 2C